jgi:hypothetical protein
LIVIPSVNAVPASRKARILALIKDKSGCCYPFSLLVFQELVTSLSDSVSDHNGYGIERNLLQNALGVPR